MSERPSTHLQAAIERTERHLPLAIVPFLASLLSLSKVAALAAPQGGGGVSFPLPTGLPTLWTFVNARGRRRDLRPGHDRHGDALGAPVRGGLPADERARGGFLGALDPSTDRSFADAVVHYLLPIVGANLLSLLAFVLALPFVVFPPLAVVVIIVVGYALYGMPFVIVVRDVGVWDAVRASGGYALAGGEYLSYAAGYLLVGTVGSFVLTWLVYNTGIVGIVVGAALVAVPALFLTAFGVGVFRGLPDPESVAV
ncbi:MAG: hypothetical protein ABEJ59_03530 [Halanaeroarchaeum sp.]